MATKILVVGYYDQHNLGDQLFIPAIKQIFNGGDFKFEFEFQSLYSIDILQLDHLDNRYKAVICGGGDLTNNHFQSILEGIRNHFKGPLLGFGLGVPYPSLIYKGYYDIYDHLFIRTKEYLRPLQRRLGSCWVHYLPDPVFSLSKPEISFHNQNHNNMKQKIIGFCPIPFIMKPEMKRFRFQLANYLKTLIYSSTDGVIIHLIPFNTSWKVDNNSDHWACNWFYKYLTDTEVEIENYGGSKSGEGGEEEEGRDGVVESDWIKDSKVIQHYGDWNGNFEKICQLFQSLDINLTMRFHSHVLSIINNVPFISLATTNKVKMLNKDFATFSNMNLKDFEIVCLEEDGDLFLTFDTKINNLLCSNEGGEDDERGEEEGKGIKFILSEVQYYDHLNGLLTNSNQPSIILNKMIESVIVDGNSSRLRKDVRTNIMKLERSKILNRLTKSNAFIKIIQRVEKEKEKEKDHHVDRSINLVDRFFDWDGLKFIKLAKQEAKELAQQISLFITDNPSTEYVWGTIQNLMKTPDKIPEMVDWIIEHFKEKMDKEYARQINLNWIFQNNFKGFHRSGWQYCMDYLQALHSENGIALDSYLDRSFGWARDTMYNEGLLPYNWPWCGFIHHCPEEWELKIYDEGNDTHSYTPYSVENMIENPDGLFCTSLETCHGIFVLSQALADWLKIRLNGKIDPERIIYIPHPTEMVDKTKWFNMNNFKRNADRAIVNIGGWYRDPYAIHLLDYDCIKQKRANSFWRRLKNACKCGLRCSCLCGKEMNVQDDNNNNNNNNNNGEGAIVDKWYADDKTDKYLIYNCKKAALKGKMMENYFQPKEVILKAGYDQESGGLYVYFDIVNTIISIDLMNDKGDDQCNEESNNCDEEGDDNDEDGGEEEEDCRGEDCDYFRQPSGHPSSENKWLTYLREYLLSNDLFVYQLGYTLEEIPKQFSIHLDQIDQFIEKMEMNMEEGEELFIHDFAKMLRDQINSVNIIEHLDNHDYDLLLSQNIVFLHLVNASAVNTLIECMVRRTPIVINPLPVVVEYLGEDYPLYYDFNNLDGVKYMATMETIEEAHEYLKNKDMKFLDISHFIQEIKNASIW